MRVKSCVASDGGGHIIKLSDEYGCVLRPKMISRFLKARAPDEKATVITYAFFHAFKFPDALSVHIKCKVEICRHGCLDHCQATGSNERNDVVEHDLIEPSAKEIDQLGVHQNLMEEEVDGNDSESNESDETSSFYDDILNGELAALAGLNSKSHLDMLKHNNAKQQLTQMKNNQQHQQPRPQMPQQPKPPQAHLAEEPEMQPTAQNLHQPFDSSTNRVPEVHEDSIDDILPNDPPMHEMLRKTYMELKQTKEEKFPQGPRTLAKDRMGMPPVAGPRSLNLGEEIRPLKPRENRTFVFARQKRSVVVSDRKVRSADVGVSGIYDVISEADLQFSPDGKQEAVTVFQGKISEEVVYGICMPVPGFSILFILVTSAAVVSALVAGSLLYRYQLQKVAFDAQQQTAADVAAAAAAAHNSFASWMTLRLFRMNQCHENETPVPK